jgi:hypothetical protein
LTNGPSSSSGIIAKPGYLKLLCVSSKYNLLHKRGSLAIDGLCLSALRRCGARSRPTFFVYFEKDSLFMANHFCAERRHSYELAISICRGH